MAARRTVKSPTSTPEPATPIYTPPAYSPAANGYGYPAEKSFLEKASPLMAVLIVVMSFALGAMWSKNKYLESGVATGGTRAADAQAGDVAEPEPKVQVSKDKIKEVFSKNVIKFGDANKQILFIEAADPSCPYCHVASGLNPELSAQMDPSGRFTPTSAGGAYVSPVLEMKKLVDSGKAAFAWVYTNGHGNGEVATKLLYCAHEQGKFWEVHDKMMTNEGYGIINNQVKNDKTKAGILIDLVKGSANAAQLKSCLDSGKYDKRLAEDSQIAAGLGMRGTPNFFVNETNFTGAYSWSDMESAVQ